VQSLYIDFKPAERNAMMKSLVNDSASETIKY
jgi:hypothetical protein